MEVEEVANYVILAYAYWRRTGDRSIHLRHGETIRRFLDFLVACDTSGNGVPDLGCTNTIDDASPAIQYGRQNVYLAVKTLAALACGADLLSDAAMTISTPTPARWRHPRRPAERACSATTTP
jgi:uncharacterized protein (DUF608 family)